MNELQAKVELIRAAVDLTISQNSPIPKITFRDNVKMLAGTAGIQINEKALEDSIYWEQIACTFMT